MDRASKVKETCHLYYKKKHLSFKRLSVVYGWGFLRRPMVLQVQEQSRTNPPIIQNHGWSLITCKTTASSPKAPVLPTVGAPSRKRVGDTQRDCIVFGQTFGGVFYTPCPNERGASAAGPQRVGLQVDHPCPEFRVTGSYELCIDDKGCYGCCITSFHLLSINCWQ